MSVVGIVSEYNPFHYGHLYHIHKSRELSGEDSTIVCAMSGDFVQRGEAAAYSKFARAEAACRCGADLVLELPLPWCMSPAESFARSAVWLLDAVGADRLSFGSECGAVDELKVLAEALCDSGINSKIKNIMKDAPQLPYARARQTVLEESLGPSAALLSQPNNILGVEYLKAILTYELDMEPMTVQRIGSGHDARGESGPHSASEIREYIAEGRTLGAFVPEAANAVYEREREKGRELSDRSYLDTAILSRLRQLSPESFANLPDGEEGLCRRIYSAVRSEGSLAAICDAAKTKRYAHSRIRRLCLSAALGLEAELMRGLPPYARVLAANERGREHLRRISDRSKLPLLTKAADIRQFSQESRRVFETGACAHDLYVLSYGPKHPTACGEDWRFGPIIV